jgi:hypothetical protein
MMFMALIHDFWMPPSPSSPTLWPYGALACGFYFGLDMAVAGVAEAWEKASSKG